VASFVRRALVGAIAIAASVAAFGCGDDSGVTPTVDASVPGSDAQSSASDGSPSDGGATTLEAAVGSLGDATTPPDGAASGGQDGAASAVQDGSEGADVALPGSDSGDAGGSVKLADGGAALACQAHLVCCTDAGAPSDFPQCPQDWASAQSCAYDTLNSVYPNATACEGQNSIVVFETETAYVFVYDATTGGLLARVTYDMGDPDPYRPVSTTCDATGDGFLLSEACLTQFLEGTSISLLCTDAGAPRYYCSGP
jgi:hypothetical protein